MLYLWRGRTEIVSFCGSICCGGRIDPIVCWSEIDISSTEPIYDLPGCAGIKQISSDLLSRYKPLRTVEVCSLHWQLFAVERQLNVVDLITRTKSSSSYHWRACALYVTGSPGMHCASASWIRTGMHGFMMIFHESFRRKFTLTFLNMYP